MNTTKHTLSPPSLEDLVAVLRPALASKYVTSTIHVTQCPDLREAPYFLATQGLSGDERVSDVGGPAHLIPQPLLDKKYSLLKLAKEMEMRPDGGQLLGAGAGPFHIVGQNSELAPNLSWMGDFDRVNNQTYLTKVPPGGQHPTTVCERSPSTDCALMVNLFGSAGMPGPVLRINASGPKASHQSFTETVRAALFEAYGEDRPISLGGVFLIKSGKAYFHVMPDFPPASDLPFKDREQAERWLTYHDFEAPIVCLTVFHSADPEKLDLRTEHTHCFSVAGNRSRGGHYHYGLDDETIEYEAYFNTTKLLYRIDKPST